MANNSRKTVYAAHKPEPQRAQRPRRTAPAPAPRLDSKALRPLIAVGAVLVAAVIIYFIAVLPQTGNRTVVATMGTSNNIEASSILRDGQVVVQDLYLEDVPLTGVSIMMATYGRTVYDVKVEGKLYSWDSPDPLTHFSHEYAAIEDDGYLQLLWDDDLPPTTNYRLEFSFTGLGEEDSLVFWLTPGSMPNCQIDGMEQVGGMILGMYSSSGFLTGYYWAIVALLLVVLTGLWAAIFVAKVKPHVIFAIGALGFGILYMLVFPPYAGFDGEAHTSLTMYYSDRWMGADYEKSGGGGRTWEMRAEDTIDGFTNANPGRSQYYRIYSGLFKGEANPGATIESKTAILGQGYQYLPQIAGVTLARLFGWGQVPTLLLGELFSLLAYVGLVCAAVRLVPFKTIFCIGGLMPLMLVVAGSFSYDTSINALSLFFTAYVLRVAFERDSMSIPDLIIMLAAGLLLAPLKYIYIPLLLLPLLIPGHKWPHPKWKPIFCGVLGVGAVAVLVIFVGSTILNSLNSTTAGSTPWDNPEGAYTWGMLLQNIPEALRLYLTTAIDGLGDFITAPGAINYYNLPLWGSVVCCALLLLAVTPPERANPLLITRGQKWVIAGSAFGSYALALAVGVQWTFIGAYHIQGVQGRYFLGLLPMLALLFYGVTRRRKIGDRALVFTICVLNACTVLYLFQRAVFYPIGV